MQGTQEPLARCAPWSWLGSPTMGASGSHTGMPGKKWSGNTSACMSRRAALFACCTGRVWHQTVRGVVFPTLSWLRHQCACTTATGPIFALALAQTS